MDLEILQTLAVVAAVLVAATAVALAGRSVVRGWSGPASTSAADPFQALVFVIRQLADLRNERGGTKPTAAIAERSRELQRESALDAFGVFQHYLAFAQGDRKSLESLSDVLRTIDDDRLSGYRTLFGALRAINEDLQAGSADLASFRRWLRGRDRGQPPDSNPQLRDLLVFVSRLSSISDQFAGWRELSDDQRGEVHQRALRLANEMAKARTRLFPEELELLREGGQHCVRFTERGLVALGEEARTSAPQRKELRLLRPLTREVVALYVDDWGSDSPCVAALTLENKSQNLPLDQLQLRTCVTQVEDRKRLTAPVERRMSFLSAGEAADPVEIAIPSTSIGDGPSLAVEIDVSYHDQTGSPVGYVEEIPVKVIDLRTLTGPYALTTTGAIPVFVGREDVMKDIRSIWRNKAYRSCVLWGMASIGKTSLLYEVQRACHEKADWSRVRAAIANLHRVSYDGNWVPDTLRGIREAIQQELQIPERSAGHDGRRHDSGGAYIMTNDYLDRVQRQLEAEDQTLLLMLDEYQTLEDHVRHRRDSDAQEMKRGLLRYFKSIMDTYPRIVLVFAGLADLVRVNRDDPTWLESIGKSSMPLEVTYLSRADSIKLIRQPMASVGFHYARGLDLEIWEATNGYPALIHALCRHLFDKMFERLMEGGPREGATIDRDLWRATKATFLERETAVFARIWEDDKWMDNIARVIGVALSKPTFNGRVEIGGKTWTSVDRLRGFLGDTFTSHSSSQIQRRLDDLIARRVVLRTAKEGDIYLRLAVPLMEEWWNGRTDLQTEVATALDALKQ